MDYNGIIDAAYAVIMLIVGLVIKSIITKAVNDIRTQVENKFDSADKAQIEKNVINDNKINFILTDIITTQKPTHQYKLTDRSQPPDNAIKDKQPNFPFFFLSMIF